jgi:hypothetical protein
VRDALANYVGEQFGCIVRRHRLAFELVTANGQSRSNVGALLAAVRLFYTVVHEIGGYEADKPLTEVTTRRRPDDCDPSESDHEGERPPRMPDVSGVEHGRSRRRLTDSFVKLVGKEWIFAVVPSEPNGHLAARLEAEFGEDVLHMDLDGSYGDHQPLTDFTIAQAAGNKTDDLSFTSGKRVGC